MEWSTVAVKSSTEIFWEFWSSFMTNYSMWLLNYIWVALFKVKTLIRTKQEYFDNLTGI